MAGADGPVSRRVELALQALRQLRERVAPAAKVLERTDLRHRQGSVVTVALADHRAPEGVRYRTSATWPSGRVAERQWSDHPHQARRMHESVVWRQAQRPAPESEHASSVA